MEIGDIRKETENFYIAIKNLFTNEHDLFKL